VRGRKTEHALVNLSARVCTCTYECVHMCTLCARAHVCVIVCVIICVRAHGANGRGKQYLMFARMHSARTPKSAAAMLAPLSTCHSQFYIPAYMYSMYVGIGIREACIALLLFLDCRCGDHGMCKLAPLQTYQKQALSHQRNNSTMRAWGTHQPCHAVSSEQL
jgi:hypothetical protein